MEKKIEGLKLERMASEALREIQKHTTVCVNEEEYNIFVSGFNAGIKANPSQFNLVSQEKYKDLEHWVELLKAKLDIKTEKYDKLKQQADEMRDALKRSNSDLQYIAYNYDDRGLKLEDLAPGLIDTTCPARAALLRVRLNEQTLTNYENQVR